MPTETESYLIIKTSAEINETLTLRFTDIVSTYDIQLNIDVKAPPAINKTALGLTSPYFEEDINGKVFVVGSLWQQYNDVL